MEITSGIQQSSPEISHLERAFWKSAQLAASAHCTVGVVLLKGLTAWIVNAARVALSGNCPLRHRRPAGKAAGRHIRWCNHKIYRGSQTHGWHRCYRCLSPLSFRELLHHQEPVHRFEDRQIKVQAQDTVGRSPRKVRRRDQAYDLSGPTYLQTSYKIHISWILVQLQD